jgi:hypothetical protein
VRFTKPQRLLLAAAFAALVSGGALVAQFAEFGSAPATAPQPAVSSSNGVAQEPQQPNADAVGSALTALEGIAVKGRAPKTGYSREQFSDGWGRVDGCDLRNLMLQRDLTSPVMRDSCIVESGVLIDPYTATEIDFVRGVDTSLAVQIDHVVAVSDAWQKGAQQLTEERRYEFYNDPLNLLAVSGPANQAKSDSDAASWLPPNRAFRCEYVAIQIAVKARYDLWVTQAEADTMRRVLQFCPNQELPNR